MPYIKVNTKHITVRMPAVKLQALIEQSKEPSPPADPKS